MTDHARTVSGKSIFVLIVAVACVMLFTAPGVDASWPRCNNGGFSCPPNVTCNVTTGFCECFAANIMSVHRNCQVLLLPGQPRTVHYDQGYSGEYIDVDGHHWMKYPSGSMPYLQIYFEMELSVKVKNSDPDEKVKPLVVAGLSMETVTKAISIGLRRTIDPNTSALVVKWDEDAIAQSDLDVFAGDSSGTWNPKNIGGYNGRNADLDIYFVELLSGSFNYSALTVGVTTFEAAVRPSVNTWFLLIFSAIVILIFLAVFALFFEELGGRKVLPKWMYLQTFPRFMKAFRRRTSIWYVMDERTARLSTEKDDSSLWERIIAGMTIMVERIKSQLKDKGRSNTKSDQQDENVEKVEEQPGGLVDKEIVPGDIPSSVLRIGPLSELSPSHVMDFSFYEILFRRTGISTMTIEEIEEFLETSPQQQLPAVRPIDAAHLQANGKKSKRGSVECFECNLSADRRYVMLFFDSVPRAQLARRILMSREASLVPVITADHYDRLNDLIRLHLQNLSNRTKESKVAAANANAVHPVDTAGKPVEESASVKTDKEAESKEDWTVPVEMGKEDLFFRRSSTFDGVMATCTCGFWLLRESIRDVSESEFASLLQDDEFIDAVYPFFQAVTCMYAKENYGNWRFCNTKYLEIADVLPKREFLGRLIPQEVTTKLHVANFRGRIGVTPVGIEKWFSLSSWVKYMPELTVSIPSLQTMGLIDYMIPVYKPPAMVVALSIKGIGLGLLSGFTSALGNFSASLGLPAGFGTPSVSTDIPSAPSVPKASLGFGSITASFAKLTAPSVSLGVPGVPVPEVSVPSVDVPDVPKMPELPAGISLETGVPGLSRLFNVPLNPVVRLRIPSLTLPSASILSFGGMCRLTMFQLRRFRFLGIIHFFTNLIMQAIVTVLMAFRIIINIFVMAASFATFLNLVGYKSLIRLQDIRASLSMFDFVIEYGYWFVEWSPIGFAVDIDVASLIPVAGSTPCGGTQAAILFIISGFLLFITYVIMKRELIFFFLIKFSIVAQSVDRKNALLKRARGKVNNFDSSTSAWGLILDTFGRGAAAVVLLLLSMAFVFIAQLYFTIFTIQRTCNGVDSILRISTIVLLSFLSVVIFDALFAVYGGKSSIDLLEQAPHRYLMQKFDGKNETVGVGYWLRRATKLVSGRPIASITADSQDPDCIVLGETASAVNDILNRSSGKVKSDAKYSSDHLELPLSPHAAKFQKKGWLSRGAKTTLAGPALERFLRTFEKQAPKSLDPEIELPDCLEKYPTVIDGSAGASSFAGCTTRDIVLALVALKPARTGSEGVVNSSTGIFGHLESSLKQTVSGVRDATFGDGVAIATSEACRAAWLRAVQSAAVKMKYWTILKEDMGVANLAFVLWATGKLPFPTTDRSTPSSVASALEALNNDVDTKWYACFVTFYLASVERSNPEPWNPVSRMFFALMICFLLPLLRIADGAWYLLKISFGLWAARTCERFALLERADVFGSSALDGSEEREAETRSAVLANIGRTNTLVFCMLPGLSFLNKLAEFLNMYPVWVPPSFNVVLTDNRVPNLMRWLSAVTIMFGSAAIIFQPIPLIGYIILFAFFFLRFVELVVSLMGSSDDKKRPKDAEAGLAMFSIGRAVVNHASKIIYDGNQKVRQLAGQADLARRMNDARQLFTDRADSVVTSMSTEKSFMRKND